MKAKPKPKPPIKIPCLTVTQGEHKLVVFSVNAKKLFSFVDINRRNPDKREGYQRTLSIARVNAISKYLNGKKPLPLSILVSLDNAQLSADGTTISIPNRKNAGWVIDGQHRLAGAYESKQDIELAVVAFLGLQVEKQIEQFVTINREAKGVPTSLYYDLLSQLPHTKSDSDLSRERAADIGNGLKRDETSPFFNRIVIMSAPKIGELSLNNFVRKVAPLVHRKSGKLSYYTEIEQRKIIDNYFRALENIFAKQFKEEIAIYFQTVGFGAVMNALPTVFDLSLKHYKAFRVEDVTRLLKLMADFPLAEWKQMGTGSAAEIAAGEEFRQTLLGRLSITDEDTDTTLRL